MATLVVLSVALLTTYFRESAGGALHTMQRGTMEILDPIQEGASMAVKPVRDLANWVGDVGSAKSENKRLVAETASLRRQLVDSLAAQRDNRQLRRLLALDSAPSLGSGYSFVSARVIARSPTVWFSTITISKGSSSGVRVDQPVLSGEGLVGRVSATSPHAAQVELVTDHASAVSVKLLPDGGSGLLQPAVGNPDDLLLNYLEKGKPIKIGAVVATAGWRSNNLESLFPPGIPVGRVTKVKPDELEIYQRVHIQPFADLRKFDVVRVLTNAPTSPSPVDVESSP